MNINWSIPTAFILFLVFDRGESLQCYICTGQRNSSSMCESNVSSLTSTNCTSLGNYTNCMTAIKNNTIERACANAQSCNSSNKYTECHLCNNDYCNQLDITNSSASVPAPGNPQPGGTASQPGGSMFQPGGSASQPGVAPSQPGVAPSQPLGTPKPAGKPGGAHMNKALIIPVIMCFLLINVY